MKEPRGGRILVLDGIRGFAMCMVLVQHYFYTREGVETFNAFDRAVFGVVDSGWWAIDSFFVLSAFLITGILCDTKGDKRYFLDFYARRTLKIFPLYYAALFLFFVVLPHIPHPLAAAYVSDSLPDQAWFWTYMTNFRIAAMGDWYGHLVPTVFWSLAVEEHFYLLWPVVVLILSRGALVRFCVALFVVALGVRVALALAGANPVATFVLTPARMDCLAVGTLLALVRRDDAAFERTARVASWAVPILVLFLVLLAVPGGKLDWKDPLTNTLGFSATALMCGGVLLQAMHAPPRARIRRLFEARRLRMIGKYSYAMYIFHGPAATAIKAVYDFDQAPRIMGSALPVTVMYTLSASLLTLAVGWLSWNLFERHFLKLKALFPGGSKRPDFRGRNVPGSSAIPAGALHRVEAVPQPTPASPLRGPVSEQCMTDPTNYLHRRFSYSWLAHTVRERSIPSTLRATPAFVAKLFRLWWWDRVHHVSTHGRAFGKSLAISGPSAAHARAYEAVDTTVLPRVLRNLDIGHRDYVFVDLGAGKGRGLFLAAEFPFKRIVGVELSPTLCEEGWRNCRTFRSSKQACRNIELICGDAADYVFPPDPLVIFVFNSFDEVVLSRVLDNLGRSIDEHPRDVVLIYLNPQHRDLVELTGAFERMLTGTDERDYRKLGYDVFRWARPLPATASLVSTNRVGSGGA